MRCRKIGFRASLLALVVTGCATQSAPSEGPDEQQKPGDLLSGSFNTRPMEAADLEVENQDPDQHASTSRLLFREGRAPAKDLLAAGDRAYKVQTLQLNFVDAPVSDVVRAIISEVLGEPVAIASGVSGSISLEAADPVAADQAMRELARVLEASSLSLTETADGFLLSQSNPGGSRNSGPQEGVGVAREVLPVQNVRPSELSRSLANLLPATLRITADDARGVILIEGSETDRADAKETVEAFDTPYLAGRVYGAFALRFSEASAVAAEIRTLLSVQFPASEGVVELIDLPRLNQIFVVTNTSNQFAQVERWIEHLDQPPENDDRRLYHHVVQHVDASRIAEQLSAILTGGASRNNLSTETTPGVSGQQRGQAAGRRSPNIASVGQTIIADEINNALIIRASAKEYRDILRLLERMDVPSPQVLIEATIAEVTLNDTLRFGVRWFFEDGGYEFTSTDSESRISGITLPGFGVQYRNFIDGVDSPTAGAAIDALSSVTEVSVISAPSIMVQNNEDATLQVGDQVPIVTRQAQAVGDVDAPIVSTVELRDTGVILNVRPRITASGNVVIEVEQEVSDVAETVTSGIDSPTIQQRQFSSTVQVRDGGTAILGGLIRQSDANSETGVPLLRRLPLLGKAFSSESTSIRRTELLVFLTPKILYDTEATDAYSRNTRRDLQRVYDLLEKK